MVEGSNPSSATQSRFPFLFVTYGLLVVRILSAMASRTSLGMSLRTARTNSSDFVGSNSAAHISVQFPQSEHEYRASALSAVFSSRPSSRAMATMSLPRMKLVSKPAVFFQTGHMPLKPISSYTASRQIPHLRHCARFSIRSSKSISVISHIPPSTPGLSIPLGSSASLIAERSFM